MACMRVESFSYAKLVKLHLCASVRSLASCSLEYTSAAASGFALLNMHIRLVRSESCIFMTQTQRARACVGLIWKSASPPLERASGTPLIGLDGRCAAVFADRTPPSPIIRDFFVMNAAGRKITPLPAGLIYLGRSLLSASMARMRRPPLQISPHPLNQVMCDAFARLNSSHSPRKALSN